MHRLLALLTLSTYLGACNRGSNARAPADTVIASVAAPQASSGPATRITYLAVATDRDGSLLRLAYAHGVLEPASVSASVLTLGLRLDGLFLILDEPTTAQDHKGRYQLADIGRRFRDQGGRTVIMITHDMDLIAHYAERLMVMWKGQILLDLPTEEALEQREILARTFLRPPIAAEIASHLHL